MTQTDPLHDEYRRQIQELRAGLAMVRDEYWRVIERLSKLERKVAEPQGKPTNVPVLGDCSGCSAERVYLVDGRLCPICDEVKGEGKKRESECTST